MMKDVSPCNDAPVKLRRRPGLVWGLCIVCALSLGVNVFFIYLYFADVEKARQVQDVTLQDVAFTAVGCFIMTLAGVLLWMRRKAAILLWGANLFTNALFSGYYFVEGYRETRKLEFSEVTGPLVGLVISGAFFIYVAGLKDRGYYK